jgi:glycosyltransferase involved in cell wall biosynthesis
MDALTEPGVALSVRAKHRRLAIVSTYNELCGIAAFTKSLVRIIGRDFDLEVFDLDQYLLRQTDRRARRIADAYFRDICRRLRDFDIVNLQLEFGTLGTNMNDSLRRLRWLCEAAPALSVTFHTVPRRQPVEWPRFWSNVRNARLVAAFDQIGQSLWWRRTTDRTFRILRQTARRTELRLIVHTPRDRKYMKYVCGFDHIHDHPLSFLLPGDVERVRAKAGREALSRLCSLPDDAKLIGVFGFLSRYKGFETAIRAMRHLPPDHHLLVFGGVHPSSFAADQEMAPYVRQLLGEIRRERTTDAHEEPPVVWARAIEGLVRQTVTRERLSDRVHFMGALPDEAFRVAMASCDTVVLPYLEVGQSSSGAASLAIELGCRTLLSRTHGFLQLATYFPDRLEFFDVGNHLELADRIRAKGQAGPYPPLACDAATLREIYLAAHAATAGGRTADKGAAVGIGSEA